MTIVLLSLAALLGLTLTAHLLSAAMTAWRESRPPKPVPDELPFIALMRPVCGIDPFDAETLGSSFNLDYPNYEVIFCAPSERDPACALVRRLIEENPQVRARLLTGLDAVSGNPKLNNLHKGLSATEAEWLAMADSNLLLPRDYLQRLVAEWRPGTGLVSAPPVAERPGNLWGAVEAAFLNTNQARWQVAADMIGMGFAQGKSLFWRRDILMAGGGFAALGRNMAEDVASTKLVRRQGLKVRLTRHLFAQPIGTRAAREVWERQLRWSKVRRDGFVMIFAAEIAQGPFLPFLAALVLAALGAMPWIALPLLVALWYGAEVLLARIAGWPASARDIAGFAIRDAMLPALWLMTWFGRDFTWRGNDMTHRDVARSDAPVTE
ncbi:ceramide glucosyltransferase [Thioclava sp. DLFJ5-1]|uniref:ceramide glucosyltransferase n=1 Tax=Thioclava sp. DLFJ5-1 TaxID=1915314 RepID=UPI001180DEA5|nr:ceramide glucosyltransferase [Thioclava sp. DLFJ5-1]